MLVESLAHGYARILTIVLVIILVAILAGIIMAASFHDGNMPPSNQFVTGGSPSRLRRGSGAPRIIEVHVGEKKPKYGYDAHFIFRAFSNDWIGNYMKRRHYLFDKHNLVSTWGMLTEMKSPIVFDVGANIGTMSIPFSRVAERVYAFEPQSKLVQLLRANVRLNKCDNIVVVQTAVGHKGTETEMDTTYIVNKDLDEDELSYDTQLTVNYGAGRLGKGGEAVTMISIDDYCKQHGTERVDLIKVDVEGAEPLVFFGAKKTIRACRPAILYEQNYSSITQKMKQAMNLSDEVSNFNIDEYCGDHGYIAKVRLPKDNFLLLDEEKLKLCNMRASANDALFVPTKIIENKMLLYDYVAPEWDGTPE